MISQFLLNNYDEVFSKTDEQDLLNVLPTSLREEVLYHQFGSLVEVVKMFNTSDDNEFVWEIAQNSQKMRFDKDDPIY